MAQAQAKTVHDDDTVLKLTRTFAAPREAVFRAFTEAGILKTWWGPKGTTCPVAEIDARPGGRYRIEMHSSEGGVHVIEGEFREVVAPSRLVYTWVWVGGNFAGREMLVTLEFGEAAGGTELRLTHELLPDAAARDLHDQGWSGSFDCLAEILAAS